MTEIVAAHLERVAKELSEAVDYFCIGADDHDYENCEKCARMKGKIAPIVAAALAACAREEREKAYAAVCQLCEAQIPLDANGRHTGSGHVGSHCYATLIRRALERAAGEKA